MAKIIGPVDVLMEDPAPKNLAVASRLKIPAARLRSNLIDWPFPTALESLLPVGHAIAVYSAWHFRHGKFSCVTSLSSATTIENLNVKVETDG